MLWVTTSLPALRARGGPLKRAAARVCREAGAAVAPPRPGARPGLRAHRHDERRIEVIANGLPLWGGSQLAVDITLVSPFTSAGVPRRRRVLGQRWLKRDEPKNAPTLSSLTPVGAAWLSSVLKSVVAGSPKLPP